MVQFAVNSYIYKKVIYMPSFNLSKVVATPPSAVQASPNYDTKTDPDTGETEREYVSKDGVSIDKNLSPKLILDGAVGHVYTELLNQELSLESMGAIVAAATKEDTPTGTSPHLGKVTIGRSGTTIEPEDPNSGYIYIVQADTLESSALGEIAGKFLDRKTKYPNKKLGLAMVSDGAPTPTVETLTRCLASTGVRFAYSREALKDMVRDMARGDI